MAALEKGKDVRAFRERVRLFAETTLAPQAACIDRKAQIPASVMDELRRSGYLGAAIPCEWGGGGIDPLCFGLLNEEIGRVCSSLRSLLTVQNLVAQTIVRFGSPLQKDRFLYALSTAQQLAAFALTEPQAGSFANAIEARAESCGEGYLLYGSKIWVTYGQIADLFLVFAQGKNGPLALVVPRSSRGLEITPFEGSSGLRGAMHASLRFDGVELGPDALIGVEGMGISLVANVALDYGRFSVAWGCVGIIRACLDACLNHAQDRRIGSEAMCDLPLVQRQLADMLVTYRSSQALCERCARLRADGDPRAAQETSLAKYHAARGAISVAQEAVQLHGAIGCDEAHPLQRYLRDATAMGIIEGTREMLQLSLGQYVFQRPYDTWPT